MNAVKPLFFVETGVSRRVPAVRATGLRKRYGGETSFVDALLGVDIDIAAGEVIGLLGPNGAGKTTLIEILEGLRVPDAGIAEVLGVRVDDGPGMKGIRGRLGISLQHSVLPAALTVTELLQLQAALYGSDRPVATIIDLLGLGEKRRARIGQLSGGQQQRVAVGMALTGAPDLLFLDEPTSQLDPHARRSVWSALDEQRTTRATTILLSTHQMEEAQRLCDRVFIMAGGRIVAQGAPLDLIDTYCPQRRISFTVGGVAELAFPGVDVDRQTLPDGTVQHRVQTHDVTGFLAALASETARVAAELKDLRIEQPTLEDVFLKLTGSTERVQ